MAKHESPKMNMNMNKLQHHDINVQGEVKFYQLNTMTAIVT